MELESIWLARNNSGRIVWSKERPVKIDGEWVTLNNGIRESRSFDIEMELPWLNTVTSPVEVTVCPKRAYETYAMDSQKLMYLEKEGRIWKENSK